MKTRNICAPEAHPLVAKITGLLFSETEKPSDYETLYGALLDLVKRSCTACGRSAANPTELNLQHRGGNGWLKVRLCERCKTKVMLDIDNAAGNTKTKMLSEPSFWS